MVIWRIMFVFALVAATFMFVFRFIVFVPDVVSIWAEHVTRTLWSVGTSFVVVAGLFSQVKVLVSFPFDGGMFVVSGVISMGVPAATLAGTVIV